MSSFAALKYLPKKIINMLYYWQERAMVNARLGLVSGEFMDLIQATDEDGLQAGQVTFEISGDGNFLSIT